MDFRYMEYLKENNKYYVESLNEEKLYILDYELKNYNLLDLDGHWIMCSFPMVTLTTRTGLKK